MYKQFYLMQKDPFRSHPSPDLFYNSHAHNAVWEGLIQGIASGDPILLATGGYGAGKTLLCLKLVRYLEQTSPKAAVVFLSSPGYSFSTALEKTLGKFGIKSDRPRVPHSESLLQNTLYEYLESAAPYARQTVFLILDDVQDFDPGFLNKLRVFAAYNHQGHFPVKVVLFGHHQTLRKLEHRDLVPLKQRIRRHYRLQPLSLGDTRAYIHFRLIYSGASGTPVFDARALSLIHKASQGIPRMINNLCDNCLLSACRDRCSLIDAKRVAGVVRRMMPGNPAQPVAVPKGPQTHHARGPEIHPAPAITKAGPPLRMPANNAVDDQTVDRTKGRVGTRLSHPKGKKRLSSEKNGGRKGRFNRNRLQMLILMILIFSLLYFIIS